MYASVNYIHKRVNSVSCSARHAFSARDKPPQQVTKLYAPDPRLSFQFVIAAPLPLFLPYTNLLVPSQLPLTPPFFAATSPGVRAKLGGTSSAGFLVKKFRGRRSSVIGSAGMIG